MSVLNSEMKRLVERQRLGFVATVCPDGTPNLSPKGTTAVWDDNHLVFADIRSRLRLQPSTQFRGQDQRYRSHSPQGVSFRAWVSLATARSSTKSSRSFGSAASPVPSSTLS